MTELWHQIHRKLLKLRLQPIRVFCFHQVSDTFDSSTMYPGDWLQTDEFKKRVISLQDQGYTFISLTDAHEHIKHDFIRTYKYAVLTADDGWASLKNILPWLSEQRIPIMLFINGKYLDGKSYRDNPKEQYLTKEELFALTSPLIEIGSHGWIHLDASKISADEFKQIIEQNIKLLQTHPRYVPFHAYTWGRYTKGSNSVLTQMNITPVLMDGMKNYDEPHIIHRELL